MDGKPFAPYAKSTLRKPQYQGKRVPDLDLSGRMLESMRKTVLDGFHARLHFDGIHPGGKKPISNSMLARIHQYGHGTQPERAFFGLTDQQRERVKAHLHHVIYDRAAKIWRGK